MGPLTARANMRLIDYPRFRVVWPPSGQSLHGPFHTAPADLSDLLVTAMHYKLPRVREWEVAMITAADERRYLRILNVGDDEAFAIVFREFLLRHVGKSLHDIGELDVTFVFE